MLVNILTLSPAVETPRVSATRRKSPWLMSGRHGLWAKKAVFPTWRRPPRDVRICNCSFSRSWREQYGSQVRARPVRCTRVRVWTNRHHAELAEIFFIERAIAEHF
jgi:hypothetical protein